MVEGQQFKVADTVNDGKDKVQEGWQARELQQQSEGTKGNNPNAKSPETPGAVGKDANGKVTHLDMSAGDPFGSNKGGADANVNAGKDGNNKNADKTPKGDAPPSVSPPPGSSEKNPSTRGIDTNPKPPETTPDKTGPTHSQPGEKQPVPPKGNEKPPTSDKHPSDTPKAPQPAQPPESKPADQPANPHTHHAPAGAHHTKPRV